jgi:hypothetical protein
MSVRTEFERLLKESPHFADVINTHRTATAEILAAFLAELIREKHIPPDAAVVMLRHLDDSTGHVSLDASRRHLVATIRDTLKRLQ